MFLTITEGNITTMIGYISSMIGDFMPLIIVVLAVSITMYIFNRLTK
jgi:hypothetical protein